jgi:uncharacterized membrane protein YqjE
MYEKLSLAFYNLELKEEKNSIVDLIFFIASIVSAIIGISFLAIVVAVLFKRKKYEK